MLKFDEWLFPDGEVHLPEWMTTVNKRRDGRLQYQGHKYEAALRWVKQRRVAVDVGSHIGLFSWPMAKDFESIEAFEAMPSHRACWYKNMEGITNATLHACALGESEGRAKVATRTVGSSGDTGVDPTGKTGKQVNMRTLDSFGLTDVDFLKVDVEGYELFVLRGSVETLKRCRPCVIVEAKPETGMADRYGIGVTDSVKFLESLGAKKRAGIQGDYILSFDD